jgi:tetratricopeptide (TPR) repeat protein
MRRLSVNLLLLTILVFVVYGSSVHSGFAFDDRIHILENQAVTSFRSALDPASLERIEGHAFGLSSRPLLFVTYGMNYASAGADPGPFRLTNVAIHAVNTLLVFWVALELASCAVVGKSRRFTFATIAACLFAVHPLLTESVTYIAGRSSSLCATFYFAGLAAMLHAGRTAGANRALLVTLSLICSTIGLLVKQDALTLPLAGVALAWMSWPDIASTRTRLIATVACALFLVVVLLVLKGSIETVETSSQQNQELVNAGFEQTLPRNPYVFTSIAALSTYYLPRMIVPLNLSVDPDVAVILSPINLALIVSAIVLIGLAAIALWLRRRDPLIAGGLTLLLVSPLAAYCFFPLADVVAEHRAYISVLGASIILAAIIIRLPRPVLIAGILVAVYAGLTIDRNQVWANERLLWKDAAAKAPEKVRPHLNLGAVDQLAGDADGAIQEYEWVLRRDPQHPAALSNLASLYLARNDLTRTEELLDRAIAGHTTFAAVYLNLGVVRLRQGRYDQARELLQKSLSLNPRQLMVHHNLGDIFYNEGRRDRAAEEYTLELQLNPNSTITREHLAEAVK